MCPSLKVPGPGALQALGSRAEQEHPELPLSCIPAMLEYLELPQVPLELPGDKEMLELQVRKGRGCRSLSC